MYLIYQKLYKSNNPKRLQSLLKTLVGIVIFSGLISCQKTFDYSVYSAYVPVEYRDTRSLNLEELTKKEGNSANKEKVCFALLSDSHAYFDDLEDAVLTINNDKDIELILVGGDITDGGMLDEYLIFRFIMEQSVVPYFTLIGNHDCLANGYTIYQEIYGPDDYVLEYKNCKFIFFNDIVWELNNREPDYFWLMQELTNTSEEDNLFVLAHIAPFSDSFSPLQRLAYTSLMDTNNVQLSIHGHHHQYYYGEHYNDSVMYMNIGSVDKRHYIKITVENNSYNMERVKF